MGPKWKKVTQHGQSILSGALTERPPNIAGLHLPQIKGLLVG